MAVHAGPEIVENGLIVALDAANPRSYPGTGSTWFDLSGKNNNASLLNGPSFVNNSYLSFDGVDDGFTAPMSCSKTRYSVDWWFYPKTRIDWNQTISFGSWGNFLWHTGSNGQYWVGTDIATRMDNVDAGSVELNKWQNWTWTFDNGLGKMYKNAVLLRQKSMNISSASEFTTVSSSTGPSGSTNGFRSILRVYSNVALTAAEIRQNFEATRDRYGI